ncbi:SDR family oxidoreductase [Limisphaera ngatamarikiensis]|jgi:NAD(P)-dependent dehydrogenase (short-subunit alcohol dehydrogenase family)|uniref:SDR family oxidoreductase n=1 Tax=Limisphaera ngatamarikiensis TaxID=1324935 RepID=A0A6M1RME7_9BACT|nr:SDR family oxidoreductase [Limisphaera ngatamarikiensis]NGO38617.1 SDR family oxidoreductase [Limisphaera ngatamarikiensis]
MNAAGLVVITGATRGLGRAMVAEFSRRGWTVAGCGRNPVAVTELARQFPEPHRFDPVDVRDDAAVRQWAETVMGRLGAPDLLLNNAAVINRLAPLWELSAQEFDLVIDVNIKGVTNVIRHFVPAMIRRGRGVIVNFSSGWGRSVDAQVAPYCATKWAIEGLTRALAEELPRGLAAVALNPGIIHTDMLESCFGSSAAAYPPPETWARSAVPFLLKLGPSHNGQSLTAPGA